MAKLILYLDQSYLSNLTKSWLGSSNTLPVFAGLWRSLGLAVDQNLLICPLSPFHFEESELDTRLEQRLYDSMERLWAGIQLLDFTEVLMRQIARKVREHARNEPPTPATWEDAYSLNPDTIYDGIAIPIERSRAGFSAWTRHGRDYHLQRGDDPPVGDLAEQKHYEILMFIRELVLRPARNFQAGSTDIFDFSLYDSIYLRLVRELQAEIGQIPSTEDFGQFLLDWLPDNPPQYLDIYATIRAHMMVRDSARRIRGSDLQDVFAASLALPYCDFFTADSYIKEVLRQTGLDEKYGVKVFSPQEDDVKALWARIDQ